MEQPPQPPQPKPRKQREHIAPHAVPRYKRMFLAELAKGNSPGVAAEIIGVAYGTPYRWRKADESFAQAWHYANEAGLDRIETEIYKSAMNGDVSNMQYTLKHRRYNREARTDVSGVPTNQTNNYFISVQEQIRQLEMLGLPTPVIESDREQVTIDADPDPGDPGS